MKDVTIDHCNRPPFWICLF